MIIHQKISYFDLLSFLNYPHFSYLRFLVLICTMGKEIGRSFKYNWSKISTPTLKEPVISSSAAHTSSASNSTKKFISSQLDNKDITTNQNKNKISNTDNIHSCIKNIILYCKHISKNSYFDLLSFLNYPHFSYFRFILLIGIMGKEIGSSYKYNQSKISNPILKKPVLSSSDSHTSSTSNLTLTSISSQLDNKDITKNQNKNNI